MRNQRMLNNSNFAHNDNPSVSDVTASLKSIQQMHKEGKYFGEISRKTMKSAGFGKNNRPGSVLARAIKYAEIYMIRNVWRHRLAPKQRRRQAIFQSALFRHPLRA